MENTIRILPLLALLAATGRADLATDLRLTVVGQVRDTLSLSRDSGVVTLDVLNASKRPITLAYLTCGYNEQFAVGSEDSVDLAPWICDSNYPIFSTLSPGQILRTRLPLVASTPRSLLPSVTFWFHAIEMDGKSWSVLSKEMIHSAPLTLRLVPGLATKQPESSCWPIVLPKTASSQSKAFARQFAKDNGHAPYEQCLDEY